MPGFEERMLEELFARKLSRRAFGVGVGGTSLAYLLAACGAASVVQGPKVKALSVGLPDLSLQLESIRFGEDISPMHTGLIFKDANGRVQPDLAESWTISPDGRTWSFTLRKGVKAHDGSTFTVKDVNAQFERYRKVSALGGGGNQTSMVQAIAKVEMPDDYHIIITTTGQPYATLLFDMPCPIPADYYARVGEDGYNKAPIGYGPFKFVSSTVNQSMVFEVNTDFWDKSRVVNFKTLTLVLLPEESTMLGAMQTGTIDVAYNLTSTSVRQLSGTPGVRIVKATNAAVSFLGFEDLDPHYHGGPSRLQGIGPANPATSPLHVLDVRHALAISIDRAGISKALYPGVGSPATSPTLPTTIGHDTSLKPYPFDPSMARQLLQQAGQSNLSVQLTSLSSDNLIPNVQNLGQAIVSGWKDVGINATYIPIDPATLNDATFNSTVGGITILSTTGPDDTDIGIYADIHCDSTQNHPQDDDPVMTALVHQLDAILDPVQRVAAGIKVDDYTQSSYVNVPLLWFSGQIPIGPKVASLTLRNGDLGPGPYFYMRAKNGSIT
jgi:peptide/nickel transport system substrate-binding protein